MYHLTLSLSRSIDDDEIVVYRICGRQGWCSSYREDAEESALDLVLLSLVNRGSRGKLALSGNIL